MLNCPPNGKQRGQNPLILRVGVSRYRNRTPPDRRQGDRHGNWLPWIEREFGWSGQTARRFIQVAEAASKFNNLENLSVDVSGLYLLAAPSTPAEVDVIADRHASDKCSPSGVAGLVEHNGRTIAIDHREALKTA